MDDQCEWHITTRMTGPDCAVMCNLINIHTYFYIPGTYIHTYIHTYIQPPPLGANPESRQQRTTAVVAVVASRVACSHPGDREGSVCSPLPSLWGTNFRLGCVALVGLYGLLVGLFGLGSVASTEPRLLGTATVQQAWRSERAELEARLLVMELPSGGKVRLGDSPSRQLGPLQRGPGYESRRVFLFRPDLR